MTPAEPMPPHINEVLAGLENPTPEALAQALNAPGLQGALNEKMGITLLEAAPDKVVGRMPVEGNTQPYGILHGGATVVLAESVGSIAAAIYAGVDRIAVGIEISATHHRTPRGRYVTATATPRHLGGTLATYLIDVVDEDGTRTATSQITCMLRPLPEKAS